jgi:hypothetical protein
VTYRADAEVPSFAHKITVPEQYQAACPDVFWPKRRSRAGVACVFCDVARARAS